MSAREVDVLADLRGAVRIAKSASFLVAGNGARIERAEAAIDAIAELIEAAKNALSDMREVSDRCISLAAVGLDEQVDESISSLSAALASVGTNV